AVIFLDIVGFTTLSNAFSSSEIVQLLDTMFNALDAVCARHDVMKIKTIGDSYMAVVFPRSSPAARNDSTLPHFVRNDTPVPHSVRNDSDLTHRDSVERVIPSEARDVAQRAANTSLEMLGAVSHIVSPDGSPVQVRLGVHCGAVTAGVIGTQRMQYDVWGDTVNVASRMESTGEPGRIHVSQTFASLLSPNPSHLRERGAGVSRDGQELERVIPSVNEAHGTWHLALRGETEVKGKGRMTTYWLEGPKG
ncbi:MAG: adenylate/guanylate cyclase domain-containing protein, partial [Ignavibacteriae bacterium]